MTLKQPTQRPWVVWRLAPDSDPQQRHIITTADGEEEITAIVHRKVDAHHIVQCVNWHADLVQALQRISHYPANANSDPDVMGAALNAIASIAAGVLAVVDTPPGATGPDHCPLALPPDPDNMNDSRAQWADAALSAFMKETGADLEDSLGDLLADLMHWSDRNNFDFEAALDRARWHYEAETTGELPN
jgi:hypothetical protein